MSRKGLSNRVKLEPWMVNVVNSLFGNSEPLVWIDRVYSDSGVRGAKAGDDQEG